MPPTPRVAVGDASWDYRDASSPRAAPCNMNTVIAERDVFVGGLEPVAWDEDRLRATFERFGAIEDLHLIKPGKITRYFSSHFSLTFEPPIYIFSPTLKKKARQKSAFAFIRFGNTDASRRAVVDEVRTRSSVHILYAEVQEFILRFSHVSFPSIPPFLLVFSVPEHAR
jgi:hypothetical protein